MRCDPSKSTIQTWKERRATPGARAARRPGWFTLVHVRTGAAFAAAAMLGGGISTSTSDHTHHAVTYLFWYGCAGLFVLVAVLLTRVIERRRLANAGTEPAAGRPINVVINAAGHHEVREDGGRIIIRELTDEEARPPESSGAGTS